MVTKTRKRKLEDAETIVPKPSVLREKRVFILYDRESAKDRKLVVRLRDILGQEKLNCSILLDDETTWVLKSYGEHLDAADKILVIFSPDFLKSEEAKFVFEMARFSCMENRENKIIVASKSCRNLPKAYSGFPRVKMMEKSWILDLIKEVKKSAPNVSTNSWTFNKQGYKTVVIDELYRDCEQKTSTSMPTLACLEQPPTLPKCIADQIMELNRAESQRARPSVETTNVSKIRKATSFCKDRETMEFLSRYCRPKLQRRRSRKASFTTRPTSGVSNSSVSTPPASPVARCQRYSQQDWNSPPTTPILRSRHQQKPDQGLFSSSLCGPKTEIPSPPNTPRPQTAEPLNLTHSADCDQRLHISPCYSISDLNVTNHDHQTFSQQSQKIHRRSFPLARKDEYVILESGPNVIHPYWNIKKSKTFQDLTEDQSYVTVSSRCTDCVFVEDEGKAEFHDTWTQNAFTIRDDPKIDLQEEDVIVSSDIEVDGIDSKGEIQSCNEMYEINTSQCHPIENHLCQAGNASVVTRKIPKVKKSIHESNLDEAEFDSVLSKNPDVFRRVKFNHEEGNFVVQLGDIVWLQTLKKTKLVSVRKRDGSTGKILSILLGRLENT